MLNYPLNLSFKILAFDPQLTITDAAGRPVLFVRQKALALKESVRVFTDETQQVEVYNIKADRIIDFSARYTITQLPAAMVGAVKRQGMKSLWRTTYDIVNDADEEVGRIHEENPWLKLLDGLLSEIPFGGLIVNPTYLIDLHGAPVMQLKKVRSIFESKFNINLVGQITEADEELLITSLIMMILLERTKG